MNSFIKKLIIAATLVMSFESLAGDLTKIQEFKVKADYYRSLSLELGEGLAKLKMKRTVLDEENFDYKFKPFFDAREIQYRIVGDPKLRLMLALSLGGEAESRLKLAIKILDTEAQARNELYLTALKTTSSSNLEAKKILIAYEKEQAQIIENLKIEIERAQATKDKQQLKKTLYKALYALGITVLVLTGLGSLLMALGAAFYGTLTGVGYGLLSFVLVTTTGSGIAMDNFLSKKIDNISELQASLERRKEEVGVRVKVIQESENYRKAIDLAAEPKATTSNLY